MRINIKGGILEADLQPDPMQEIQEGLMDLAQQTGARVSEIERGFTRATQEISDEIVDSEERIFVEIDNILDEISRLKKLRRDDVSKAKALSRDLKRQLVGVALKSEVDRLEKRIKKVNKTKKVTIKSSKEFYNDVVELDDMSNNQTRNLVNQVRQNLPKPVKTRREKGVKDGTKFTGKLEDKSKLPI